MQIEKEFFSDSPFGAVYRYHLTDSALSVSVLDLGGILQSVRYRETELVCNFPDAFGYLQSKCYYGAIIGRCCNRMAHLRIGQVDYPISRNENGCTHLHGGNVGFDKKLWEVHEEPDALALVYRSPDGEEGYPGDVTVTVRYTVRKDALEIRYEAVPEADTAINLTNHAYFNLDGPGGTVLAHEAQIFADRVSVCDERHIPTGETLSVKGTPLDFGVPKPIGRDILAPHPQLTPWGGYDNNYLLCNHGKTALAARVSGKRITLEVWTDQPCLQFYTANDSHGEPMNNGFPQIRNRAFCVETQREPNAVNFANDICKANIPYRTETIFRFLPHGTER